MVAAEPFLFMQEGAGAHQMRRDDGCDFIPREECPGNSPDLNPTENPFASSSKCSCATRDIALLIERSSNEVAVIYQM